MIRLAREGTNPIGSGCFLMEIATLHIANAKTGEPFREARLAMLTHRALHHIDIADAAAERPSGLLRN